MKEDVEFYKNISIQNFPLETIYEKNDVFEKIPRNWYVIVADVENSTIAVKNNQHDQVNLAATGSIIAVLNLLKRGKNKIKIPYFFGGDGATFIVPESIRDLVLRELLLQKNHVYNQWGLRLRVGAVSVSEANEQGHDLRIAKARLNDFMIIPLMLGTGLNYAEQSIKKAANTETENRQTIEIPNLQGMECRWDKIAPNTKEKRIVCLLVYTDDNELQRNVYQEVLTKITELFGSLEERQPITVNKMKLDTSRKKIRNEMFAAIGKDDLSYWLKNWMVTYIGKFYFKYFDEGRAYLERIRKLSDTLMMDGSINTVFSGTPEAIAKLRDFLDAKEKQSELVYGLHVTHSSVMSCYVRDRNNKHIHFVDGTEGGYTSAAAILKSKKAKLNTSS